MAKNVFWGSGYQYQIRVYCYPFRLQFTYLCWHQSLNLGRSKACLPTLLIKFHKGSGQCVATTWSGYNRTSENEEQEKNCECDTPENVKNMFAHIFNQPSASAVSRPEPSTPHRSVIATSTAGRWFSGRGAARSIRAAVRGAKRPARSTIKTLPTPLRGAGVTLFTCPPERRWPDSSVVVLILPISRSLVLASSAIRKNNLLHCWSYIQ